MKDTEMTLGECYVSRIQLFPCWTDGRDYIKKYERAHQLKQ